jgi:hypothetical protein
MQEHAGKQTHGRRNHGNSGRQISLPDNHRRYGSELENKALQRSRAQGHLVKENHGVDDNYGPRDEWSD